MRTVADQDVASVLAHFEQAAGAARLAAYDQASGLTRSIWGPDEGELRHVTDLTANGRNELQVLAAGVRSGRLSLATLKKAALAREADLQITVGAVARRQRRT